MAKVITFSRNYPGYHPKAGQPTYFLEKFWNSTNLPMNYYMLCDLNKDEAVTKLCWDFWKSCKKQNEIPELKHHTIRVGHRWKAGDFFSPRVWGNDINPKSGKSGPYNSKQIVIGPDTEIKKVWDFEIHGGAFRINDDLYDGETESIFEKLETIALNDGLNRHDLMAWFKYPKPFSGQIICWNESIEY